MPRVSVTAGAADGLERCRAFLQRENPRASRRAGRAIEAKLARPATTPEIGRPMLEAPHLRELVIEFGESGYVALYRYDEADDAAYVLAFRHQKEAGC